MAIIDDIEGAAPQKKPQTASSSSFNRLVGKNMDITSARGTKVKLINDGGYQGDREHAEKHLVVGKIYTVRKTEVGSWSSRVVLEEAPNQRFNTVLFDHVSNALESA